MSKRGLLICFDAFGTLFTPKRPVHQQYAEVARAVGLQNIRDADVERTFKDAFKQEASQHPNFGKAKGMNSEQWWTNIITNTFLPIVGKDTQLPRDLVPKLLHRFWSDEGYVLVPGVRQFFEQLREYFDQDPRRRREVLVGVITNSDDRVPDTLTALGLRVGPLRYGGRPSSEGAETRTDDINFTIMSYDVGHEKPAREIFVAAEQTASADAGESLDDWRKIYVGDEYKKDVLGATNAGWNAVLVGPRDERSE
ncbi:HAD-like domain-containing protein [Neohortaea acidophila]|uniref:HAD-like domain-containing protein n=1 Tax=Neohortaea acidophila TaxID=245834 RepID=A0A6A6Q6L4_9PEZI|nr:HAD-like domain-containing protein [Neohortaea acidophila]KAF2487922.1 HAD-like domain-containing protein [Neohortaea acidophila]